jgi:hypothetical protein
MRNVTQAEMIRPGSAQQRVEWALVVVAPDRRVVDHVKFSATAKEVEDLVRVLKYGVFPPGLSLQLPGKGVYPEVDGAG